MTSPRESKQRQKGKEEKSNQMQGLPETAAAVAEPGTSAGGGRKGCRLGKGR